MAETLVGKSCTPRKGGMPPLTGQEAERLRAQVPKWELREFETLGMGVHCS